MYILTYYTSSARNIAVFLAFTHEDWTFSGECVESLVLGVKKCHRLAEEAPCCVDIIST